MGYLIAFTNVCELEIPLFQPPLSVTVLGSSAWAWAYRVDIKNDSGEGESYFMKVNNFFKNFKFYKLIIKI